MRVLTRSTSRGSSGAGTLPAPLRENEAFGTAGRFMLVGVLNTLLDISAFTLLRLSVGVAVLPANVIAYGAGIINSFWWHRLWTYAHQPRKSVVVQFARFAIVSLSALLLNTFLVFWLSPRLGALSGSTAAGDLCAKLCATGIGLGWNFLANNAWTFRAEPISE